MRPTAASTVRLTDLVAVLEALVPAEEATAERMLLVLGKLRRAGRMVVLETSPAAFARLATSLDMSEGELEHAFRQAPEEGRQRFKAALTAPESQGCVHLQGQLAWGPHAAATLEAFITARWYAWPGMRVAVKDSLGELCCCGRSVGAPEVVLEEATPYSMSAIDI